MNVDEVDENRQNCGYGCIGMWMDVDIDGLI
jgi:hypothetical protein